VVPGAALFQHDEHRQDEGNGSWNCGCGRRIIAIGAFFCFAGWWRPSRRPAGPVKITSGMRAVVVTLLAYIAKLDLAATGVLFRHHPDPGRPDRKDFGSANERPKRRPVPGRHWAASRHIALVGSVRRSNWTGFAAEGQRSGNLEARWRNLPAF